MMRVQRPSFHATTQLMTVAVVAVDSVLVATGTISWAIAGWLFVAVELPLFGLVFGAFVADIVARRRDGSDLAQSIRQILAESPFYRLAHKEIRAYVSVWRWIRGHTDVPQDGVPLVAHEGTLAIPAAFGVATCVELVVLHLVLPWPWLRLLLAVVSVWSLVALLGLIAIHRVHPHYVTDTHLVLRQSGSTVLSLCRTDIASVALVRRFSETTPTIRDGRLFLPNANGTSVDITLRSQVDAQLPALIPKYRQAGSIGQLSLCLDHPADFVALMKAEAPRT